ncbi:hypothetical protein BGZ49_010927, partial [Haplosporangium sp. Z 27]
DIRTETQDVNQAQIQSTDQQDTTTSSSLSDSTKTIPSKKAGTHLFSAFETIVFSESQIPVFLSQDHRQQRLKNKNKNSETVKETKQQQRQVSAITDKLSNYVQDGVSLGNENDYVIDSTRFNVALSKRGSLNTDDHHQQQDNAVTQSPSAYIDDDKNSLVTSSNQVQDKEYQLNENDALPTPVDQESSFEYLPHHGHRYQNYAYIYHGCASTPAFLLVLFPALLLVAYRVYLRKQRQGLTLLPTDIKSSSSSLSSPVLSDADLKIPRRASESLRDDKSCFVGYNI